MLVAATPRGLVDPGPPSVPQKTLTRWDQFLGSIAAGVLLQDAMLKHFMTRADIEACVRASHENRTAWDEARVAALKRGWSAFEFEDIFEKIAGGVPVMRAIGQVKGMDSVDATVCGTDTFSAFNRIVIQDAGLAEQYLTALKARSLVMQEEIITLADDSSGDIIDGPKGKLPNNAAVNRSKLQVETRTRLMSAWNAKMFGETKQSTQVNVQVNYAEKLEEARTRATTRSNQPANQPALTREFVEATFADLPENDEMSFLDQPAIDPATDTTWLEG